MRARLRPKIKGPEYYARMLVMSCRVTNREGNAHSARKTKKGHCFHLSIAQALETRAGGQGFHTEIDAPYGKSQR